MKLTDKPVQVPCKCKKKISVKMGDLRPGNSVVCPSCGTKIEFSGADIAASMKRLETNLKKVLKLR